ncbi:MAG: AAA family ATPase, partial [Bacteroidota bacterium]
MIKHLIIKNYALIEHLEITPSRALNVITGETGAGKSIMLGALGLLLGNRADKKALFNEDAKCIVEGTFDISAFALTGFFEQHDLDYQQECIIRREITAAGKSRAFINDTPTTLEIVKKLGEYLVDIHSQHDTLLLGESLFQLNVIDQFAVNEVLLQDYKLTYKEFRNHKKQLEQLRAEQSEINKEHDYNLFILEELIQAELKPDELPELEGQLEILENSEEIKSRFNQAIAIGDESEYSVTEGLTALLAEMKTIRNFSQSYNELYERLLSTQIEFSDVVSEIRNLEAGIEVDPQELQFTRDRVDNIQRLIQKHGVQNVNELITLQEELAVKVSKVKNFDEVLSNAENTLNNTEKQLHRKAEKLSKARQKVFKPFEKQLISLLQKVGITEAAVSIEQNPVPPGTHGADQIDLLFSANKGISPQQLKKVASGGEFSRLMFCIKS